MTGDVVLFDSFADDFFAEAVAVDLQHEKSASPSIHFAGETHIRSVPSIQPAIISGLQQRQRFFLLNNPWLPTCVAKTHSAQDRYGHSQTAVAETFIIDFCLRNRAIDRILLDRTHCEMAKSRCEKKCCCLGERNLSRINVS